MKLFVLVAVALMADASVARDITSLDGQAQTDAFREVFRQFLPEECASTVDKVIIEENVRCFRETDLNSLDFANATAIAVLCQNDCGGRMVAAVQAMADNGCLPPVDEDTPSSIYYHLQSLHLKHDVIVPFLRGTCAEAANGEYCANVIPIVHQYLTSPSTFSAADCQSILDYGNCIGNVHAAVNVNPGTFGDDTANATAIIDALDSRCTGEGVDGIKSASESTEAPANLASSSANAVSGVIAIVVAAVAATIMA